MKKRAAFWITAMAGLIWTGIGLRDIFAPHLFRFDGQAATNTTVVLDFVVGGLLNFAALALHGQNRVVCNADVNPANTQPPKSVVF